MLTGCSLRLQRAIVFEYWVLESDTYGRSEGRKPAVESHTGWGSCFPSMKPRLLVAGGNENSSGHILGYLSPWWTLRVSSSSSSSSRRLLLSSSSSSSSSLLLLGKAKFEKLFEKMRTAASNV